MNREIDKTKDLRDGVLLLIFILVVITFFSGSLSYKKYKDNITEKDDSSTIIIDEDIKPIPTFIPNTSTEVYNPEPSTNNSYNSSNTSSSVQKINVTYATSEELMGLIDIINEVLLTNVNSSNNELNSKLKDLEYRRNVVMGYLSDNITASKYKKLREEIYTLIDSIANMKNSYSIRIEELLNKFSLLSTEDDLNKLNTLIGYLPDSNEKNNYIEKITLITNILVNNEETFIMAINSSVVKVINLNIDIVELDINILDLSNKKIIGNNHIINSVININNCFDIYITDLVINNQINISNSNNVYFSNINLNNSTSCFNLVNSHVNITNISKKLESVSNPFMIMDKDSIINLDLLKIDDKVYLNDKLITSVSISSYQELIDSLNNDLITTINITKDITLLDNVTLNKNITINGKIILDEFSFDLNGFKLSGDLMLLDDFIEEVDDVVEVPKVEEMLDVAEISEVEVLDINIKCISSEDVIVD